MTMMELVRRRRSVRSFDGKGLTAEELTALLDYAEGTETPYGLTIQWRLLKAGEQGLSCPVITGTEDFIAGKLDRAPHAEEAFGYAFERFVLHAAEQGIGTTWVAGTMDRPAFERAMDLEAGQVMPCVSPLGRPAAKMSLRESMMRKGVKADSRLAFEELFFDGSFDSPLTAAKAAPELAEALELVRWAPSAVNRQPWRVLVREGGAYFYEKQSRGYVDKSGWDLQKVDMGIALCHFALGLAEQGSAMDFSLEDPGLETPADTRFIAAFLPEA